MKQKFFLILIFIFSCSTQQQKQKTGDYMHIKEIHELSTSLNKNVIITGVAYNRKGGAVIDFKGEHIWIDNIDSWTEAINKKTIMIKGQLVKRSDNPVVLIEENGLQTQGIPVKSAKELDEQKYRYWILNAVWQKVD